MLDLSSAALETDLRPSRLGLLSVLLPVFINSFFSTNPLSQLSITLARRGLAERLTELGGSPQAHCDKLKNALSQPLANPSLTEPHKEQLPVTGGAFSLQNAVEQALASLAHVPPYGSREVLVLQSSLASCDPVRRPARNARRRSRAPRAQGNIHRTLEEARAARVRISVIGFGGEASRATPAPAPAPP